MSTTRHTFLDFEADHPEEIKQMQFLDETTLQNRLLGNNPFQDIQSTKSFEEIKFDKAKEKKTKCGDYFDTFVQKTITLKILLDFIKKNKTSSNTFFDPEEFTISELITIVGSSTVPIPFSYQSKIDNHFEFEIENRQENQSLDIRLNPRACYVAFDKPGFKTIINPSDGKILFQISYNYYDALKYREYNLKTVDKSEYYIEDKYCAIIIETDNPEAFLALTNYVGHQKFVSEILITTYVNALKSTNDPKYLKFIYENTPNFILKELLSNLKHELWNHVELLTKYDDSGIFSDFVDGSAALINVFKAFGESYFLIEKFMKDPALLKRIFNNLDGSSMIDNQIVSNRMVFASLINACMTSNIEFKDKKTILDKTFYIGNGFSIDSDITSIFSDEKEDEFFLKQRKTITSKGTAINANDFTEEEYQSETKVDTEDGQMYHPLDIVKLVDYSLGIPIHARVPVVFVKALASEEEWKDINRTIRIGFDCLAIIAGLFISFTTANPGALALALAEISLATGDITVQEAIKELEKTPEGREFLETWEKIYMLGGLLLAGPALVETVILKGARLLSLVKTATSAKFLKTCLLKVLLEIEIANFTKNTVKFFESSTELVLATKGVLDNIKLDKLYQQGAFVVKGSVQTAKGIEEQVAIVYKSKAIVVANKWEFAKATKDIIKNINDEKKLVEVLEEMFKNGGIPFLKGFSREKILSYVKGLKPNPLTYLPKEFITNHLSFFYEKASYLVPKSDLDKYGREIIGRADGQFVMTGKEMDKLLLKAEGKISYIEKELGIPEGWWKNKDIVRIDILKPKKLNIRIPSGNESGANKLWLPGGKLPTGYLEAVLDAIPKNMYKETNLKLK